MHFTQFRVLRSSPTLLDVVLAAHLHLLLQSQPDALIRDLLSESYPQLVAYSKSICQVAFPDPLAFPSINSSSTNLSFSSIFSVPKFWQHSTKIDDANPEVTKTVRQFRLLRWGFFAAVVATLGLYLKFGNLTVQTQFLLSQNIPELKEVKEEILRRAGTVRAGMGEDYEADVEVEVEDEDVQDGDEE